MKILSKSQIQGLVFLLPLALVLVALAIVIELLRPPVFLADAESLEADSISLREFNPNTFTYEQLRSSGVPTDVAVGIVRWRGYGKVYRIKEDLAQVSGVNDSLYALLKPYIIIADSLAPKPYRKEPGGRRTSKPIANASPHLERKHSFPKEQFLIDTASVEYLTRWGLSTRQAEVVIHYRETIGGIKSQEQLRKCYVLSEEVAQRMLEYVIFQSEHKTQEVEKEECIELNSADSQMLVSLQGIGPKSASQIIKYRNLLGGYHSKEQLLELNCILEQNYEKILQQIYCDSCKIKKIDINFAPPKEVARHPYVSDRILRKIIKQRQLKGGWNRIGDLVDENILTEDEARRLAPYLRFRLSATE